jgi:hypothetical protein
MNRIFKLQSHSKKNFMKVLRTYIKKNKTKTNNTKINKTKKNKILNNA